MIEVETKEGKKLVADKLHIDTIGVEYLWMWFFGKDGNCHLPALTF